MWEAEEQIDNRQMQRKGQWKVGAGLHTSYFEEKVNKSKGRNSRQIEIQKARQ